MLINFPFHQHSASWQNVTVQKSSFKPTAWKLCMRAWFFRQLSMLGIARASKYLFSKDWSFYTCICYSPSCNAGIWWHRQHWRKSKCNNWTLLRNKSKSTTWPFLCSRSSKTNIRISEVDFLWHSFHAWIYWRISVSSTQIVIALVTLVTLTQILVTKYSAETFLKHRMLKVFIVYTMSSLICKIHFKT